MHLNSGKHNVRYRHSVGDGTMCQEFKISQLKKATRKIYDEKGKVIASQEIEIPYLKNAPTLEELHPVSETADMYSLPNLQAMGVKLTPVSSNFIPLSLEQLGDVMEKADSIDFDSLNSNSVNSQNSDNSVINFNENEG